MRAPRTLPISLLREVLEYTAVGFTVIAVVMVSQNLLRTLDELVAVGFSAQDLLGVLCWSAVVLAPYALPISFLFGVLVAVGRMASDSEIAGMRACGVGLRQVAPPVVALGVALSWVTGYLLLEVDHRAQRGMRELVRNVVARGALVEPGHFKRLGDRVFYVRSRSRDGQLEGVLISDRSDPARPFVVFAESGHFDFDDADQAIRLRLHSGDIHLERTGSAADTQRISFATLDYAVPLKGLLGVDSARPFPKEMSMEQLRAIVARARAGDALDDLRRRDPVEYELQIHRRAALPLAPTLFALLGVLLGLRPGRAARARGAFFCALLALSYYALLTSGQLLARSGLVSAAVASWAPNGLLAAAAVPLALRARRPAS